ncbi:MAG: DNA-deoxyinosine glycosylase [Rhodanobacteraceae bacterium]|nr:DNA-deoxyinosine glycosylase [Rhodanobacteraceae bacterium]
MAESLLHSFPPLVATGARLLILGSMPGAASLAAQQYYAHPRNAFWPILAAWCGVAADAPYSVRVDALARAGIALWDVLAQCRRPGSLDSAIDPLSAQPNAIGALLDAHPGIVRVCFNGGAAADLHGRHGLPGPPRVELVRLPSTSPAHAGMPLAEKLRRWHGALALG